jgi:Bacterial regulatory protein, Fis family
VLFSRSEHPALATLNDALLDLVEAPASEASIQQVLRRLADGSQGLLLACVWLRCAGNACTACQTGEECSPGEEGLHLAATAAPGTADPNEEAFRRLSGVSADVARALSQPGPVSLAESSFDMLPRVAAWARGARVSSFWGQRLAYRDMDLGAIGVFSSAEPAPSDDGTLRLLAAQMAMALANERLMRELDRLRRTSSAPPSSDLSSGSGKQVFSEQDVRRFERQNILAALEATKGRVYGRGGAAELLGLKPTTLASRLKKLGISIRAPIAG